MTEIYLKVTKDGQVNTPEYVTVREVLNWREWSQREADAIGHVVNGNLRRLSTINSQGVFCDLEPDDREAS